MVGDGVANQCYDDCVPLRNLEKHISSVSLKCLRNTDMLTELFETQVWRPIYLLAVALETTCHVLSRSVVSDSTPCGQ